MKGLPLKNKIYFPKKYVFNENLSLKFIIKNTFAFYPTVKPQWLHFFLRMQRQQIIPTGKQKMQHNHPHKVKPELKVPAWHTGHVPPY
jgi:hypothetical protein